MIPASSLRTSPGRDHLAAQVLPKCIERLGQRVAATGLAPLPPQDGQNPLTGLPAVSPGGQDGHQSQSVGARTTPYLPLGWLDRETSERDQPQAGRPGLAHRHWPCSPADTRMIGPTDLRERNARTGTGNPPARVPDHLRVRFGAARSRDMPGGHVRIIRLLQAIGGMASLLAAGAAPAVGQDKPDPKVWDNYDFIPGSRVIFFTDFSEDRVGNFARGLKFKSGQMEVVERDGVKVLRSTPAPSSSSRWAPSCRNDSRWSWM